jgi:GNAT superfamily N-acetyltransferase
MALIHPDFTVRRFSDGASFLNRAEDWLLRFEAEHNLLLGIAPRLTAGSGPFYLATVEEADQVAGCAFRTPPYKLGLTRMPLAAIPQLVDDVATVYDAIPAVLGPEPEASSFAEQWSTRHGTAVHQGMKQRIYQLERVTFPTQPPRGAMRVAQEDDAELLSEWLPAFNVEVSGIAPHHTEYMHQRIAEGALVLWVDGEPRSLAGISGRTPNGARVGYVYTPPQWRGRGYASACVAQLSQRELDAGRRFCFLYTDLSNPTSNQTYQRLGYQPVCDVVDIHF